MPPPADRHTYPARERWFWVGVGFVSALAILMLGLVFATFLMARERPKPMVRQAAAPTPPPRRQPPVSLPPPPSEPGARPRAAGAAPQRRQASAVGTVPKALAGAPRKPSSPVRIVERAGPPRPAGPPPPSSPKSAASARPLPRPVPVQPGRPDAASARPPAEQVGGSREEWAEPWPRDRIGTSARRDRDRSPSGGNDEPDATSGGTTPPELITGREAEYPIGAMADGVTGTVELKIIVDREGFVERALVVRSSGDRRLDAAAIRAALAWRYQPARRGRRAVSGVDTATFEFFRDGRRGRQ